MGILRVEDISKSFGIEEIFRQVSFEVARGDKVGFVGANGAGKSTLMRCLMGLEETDGGKVKLDALDTVGYVRQEASLAERPLFDELCDAFADVLHMQDEMKALEAKIAAEKDAAALEALADAYGRLTDLFERAGGYDYESRIRRAAFGLGFCEADFERLATEFSGGQQTRICLAKALLRSPDFLFLDEPTNHLDILMTEWLEEFLISYTGGVLLISHDRFFLDRVANRMIELENKTVTAYKGNYTEYVRLKAERRAALENAYEKQQLHIRATEEYIRRYKAGIKSKQARGREKQLSRLERIMLPPAGAGFNHFAFNPPGECAKRVAELEDVAARYGEKKIFENVSLLIRGGDGVALVGPNGAGKTTLLKILVGELEAASGRVKLGSRVQIGYFSQQHEGLNGQNRLIDELIYNCGIKEEQSRHYLGAFLFRGDDVYKLVGSLSGGEKSRLAFLKLMLTGANFIVLDEPTNHLDIPAKEAIEEALMTFPGTFITVSHDRYFLDKVTNCTLALEDGRLSEYAGNYSYYRQRRRQEEAALAEEKAARSAKEPRQAKQAARAPEKKMKPRRLSSAEREKLQRRYEGEIAMLEMELKGLEYQLSSPETHSDPEKSRAAADEYAAKEAALAEKYDLWASCAEESPQE